MPSDPVNRAEVAVVVAGRFLLGLGLRRILQGEGFTVCQAKFDTPVRATDSVAEVRGDGRLRVVAVLADPVESVWLDWARESRASDKKLGVIVVTARPSYLYQRRWRQKLDDGRCLANGLLSCDSTDEDLCDAIEDAHGSPEQDGRFWLDKPRHPAAFYKTAEGEPAGKLRKKEELHRTLVLASEGMDRDAAPERLGITRDQLRVRLREIQGMLGAKNDVQLGRVSSELALFDDLEGLDPE